MKSALLRAYFVLIVAVGVLAAARIAVAGTTVVAAPIETTGQESSQPILAALVAGGEPLYRDWRRAPHMLAIYGPLTYAVPGWIAGASGATPRETWIIGRLVSTAAAVVTLLVALAFMRRAGVRPSLRIVGTLALVPVLNIWSIAFTFRADMAMIACGLSGLLIAGDWRGRWRWLALPLFVGAIAYKQYAVAAPAAVFFVLIADRRIRDAMHFSVAMAGAGLAYIALMQLLTHGWFLANALGAASAAYSLENVRSNLVRFVLALPFIAIPGLWLVGRSVVRRQLDSVSAYTVASFLIATVLSGRTGSDVNYFVEAFIGLAIQAIVFAEERVRALASASNQRPLARAVTTLAALCFIPFDRYPPSAALSLDRRVDLPRVYESAIAPIDHKKIFAVELSAGVVANIPPLYSDGFIMDEMIASGRFSADSLIAEFRARGYTHVLMPDRVLEWQGLSVVPRPLLAEVSARVDRQSLVKLADIGGGRSLYLGRLNPLR